MKSKLSNYVLNNKFDNKLLTWSDKFKQKIPEKYSTSTTGGFIGILGLSSSLTGITVNYLYSQTSILPYLATLKVIDESANLRYLHLFKTIQNPREKELKNKEIKDLEIHNKISRQANFILGAGLLGKPIIEFVSTKTMQMPVVDIITGTGLLLSSTSMYYLGSEYRENLEEKINN